MKQRPDFSQFVFGKTIGGSAYQIVSHTADFIGQEAELAEIQATHSLVGPQPSPNLQAVGLFRHQAGCVVLVQAEPATIGAGTNGYDSSRRPFLQQRYIYLPIESIREHHGMLLPLLSILIDQPIPAETTLNPRLAAFPAAALAAPMPAPEQVADLIRQVAALRDAEHNPLLLQMISALINGRRLIMDGDPPDGPRSEQVLECLVSLLPATCRYSISIAAGAIDEQHCTWPRALIKFNGPPTLNEEVVWFDRRGKRLVMVGEAPQLLGSRYATLLRPLIEQPDLIPRLLETLDSISDPDIALASLNTHDLPLRLLDLLSEPQHELTANALFVGMRPQEFQALLPTIVDCDLIPIALEAGTQQILAGNHAYQPLIADLWMQMPDAKRFQWLREHDAAAPALVETLIRRMIDSEEQFKHLSADQRHEVLSICCSVITKQAVDRFDDALSFVDYIVKHIELTEIEQFSLFDAAINQSTPRPSIDTLLQHPMLALLFRLPAEQFMASHLRAALLAQSGETATLLERVVTQRHLAFRDLIDLTRALHISGERCTQIYADALSVWRPAPDDAIPLLIELILDSRQAPSEADWSWQHTLGAAAGWFQEQLPDIVQSLERLALNPDWLNWQELVQHLTADPIEQMLFLDRIAFDPVAVPFVAWLSLIARSQEYEAHFAHSYTLSRLKRSCPASLQKILHIVTGPYKIIKTNLLDELEQIRATIHFSVDILFWLIERAVQRTSIDSPTPLRQITTLVAAYLQYQRSTDHSVIWQQLHNLAPQLALIFNALLTGADAYLLIDRLLIASDEHLPVILRWIQLSGRRDQLRGALLERLVHSGAHHLINREILQVLSSDATAIHFQPQDWINATYLCWTFPAGQFYVPRLSNPFTQLHKNHLADQARIFLQSTPDPSKYLQRVLEDAKRCDLDHALCANILTSIPAAACTIDIVYEYLYIDGKIIDPIEKQHLVSLVLRLNVSTDEHEQATLKKCFIDLLISLLHNHEDIAATLEYWRKITQCKHIYDQAFQSAIYTSLQTSSGRFFEGGDTPISRCVALSKRLQGYELSRERQIIAEAAQSYRRRVQEIEDMDLQ
jgi:hypothetical protein